MNDFRLTLVGLVLSITTLLSAIVFELDLFEQVIQLFRRIEHFEADELVLPLLIFLTFFVVDLLRRFRRQRIEHEKSKIYQAMLRSTHHVLNNFLNQMQWFKIVAEETPGFERPVIDLYDRTIAEAKQQVQAMGEIPHIDSLTIEQSVSPKARPGKAPSPDEVGN